MNIYQRTEDVLEIQEGPPTAVRGRAACDQGWSTQNMSKSNKIKVESYWAPSRVILKALDDDDDVKADSFKSFKVAEEYLKFWTARIPPWPNIILLAILREPPSSSAPR